MTTPLFKLSSSAENQVNQLLSNNPNAKGLKIGLNTKGCAGLSYTMEYANDENIISLENTGQVKVKLTFDPPWNKDMMSDDARLALGYQ